MYLHDVQINPERSHQEVKRFFLSFFHGKTNAKLTNQYGFMELTKMVWSFLLEKKLSAKKKKIISASIFEAVFYSKPQWHFDWVMTFFHSNRQGGGPCVFKFTPKPSSDVTSVSATFESIEEISLTKLPNDVEYLGFIPGLYTVSRYMHKKWL